MSNATKEEFVRSHGSVGENDFESRGVYDNCVLTCVAHVAKHVNLTDVQHGCQTKIS